VGLLMDLSVFIDHERGRLDLAAQGIPEGVRDLWLAAARIGRGLTLAAARLGRSRRWDRAGEKQAERQVVHPHRSSSSSAVRISASPYGRVKRTPLRSPDRVLPEIRTSARTLSPMVFLRCGKGPKSPWFRVSPAFASRATKPPGPPTRIVPWCGTRLHRSQGSADSGAGLCIRRTAGRIAGIP